MERQKFSEITPEALAEALYKTEQQFVMNELSKLEFPVEEFKRVFLRLKKESDPALVVIAFSYIDRKLRELMMKALNPELVGGTKTLFQTFGPLGTASACIEMAAALFFIKKEVYAGLRALRQIRNHFAHEPFSAGFEEQRVAALLNSFESHKQVLDFIRPGLSSKISKRLFFHSAAVSICGFMIVEMSTAPIVLRRGHKMLDVMRVGWDALPGSIRSFNVEVADVVLELVRDRALSLDS